MNSVLLLMIAIVGVHVLDDLHDTLAEFFLFSQRSLIFFFGLEIVLLGSLSPHVSLEKLKDLVTVLGEGFFVHRNQIFFVKFLLLFNLLQLSANYPVEGVYEQMKLVLLWGPFMKKRGLREVTSHLFLLLLLLG